MADIKVNSKNVKYTATHIESRYAYNATDVEFDGGKLVATPRETIYTFRTDRRVPRLGCMLVGWGGNNGSTVTAAMLANKHDLTWQTKEGEKRSNYFGSLTQASTVCLGTGPNGDVYVPFKDLLPMAHPNDIVLDGKFRRLGIFVLSIDAPVDSAV